MDIYEVLAFCIAASTTLTAAIFFVGPGIIKYLTEAAQVITEEIVNAATKALAEWREIFCNTCEDDLLED